MRQSATAGKFPCKIAYAIVVRRAKLLVELQTALWYVSQNFVPVVGIGDVPERRGDVATVPTCGPFLILSSCWALGISEKARVM